MEDSHKENPKEPATARAGVIEFKQKRAWRGHHKKMGKIRWSYEGWEKQRIAVLSKSSLQQSG